jgi:hypothetical protein
VVRVLPSRPFTGRITNVLSGGGMRIRMLGILALAYVLTSGCTEKVSEETTEVTKDQSVSQGAAAAVPAEIEALMAKEFPADGEIHVIASKGRIDIKLETPVCFFPDSFVPENDLLFTALNQPTSLNGGGRLKVAVKGNCKFIDSTVLFGSKRFKNRKGKPHKKVVLSVWQGDIDNNRGAYWIAGVERIEGLHSSATKMTLDEYSEPDALEIASEGFDGKDLSNRFVDYVVGGKGK